MALNVLVKRGAVVIEDLGDRPVRTLPDRNTAAVVYSKMAYPLRADSVQPVAGVLHAYIDLADRPTPKDQTTFPTVRRALVQTGEANFLGLSERQAIGPAQPSFRWHVETNAYGHYLVFDGDRIRLNGILDALRNAGILWVRAEQCFRPADDGYRYDWFVRFEKDDRTSQQVAQQVEPLLGNVSNLANQPRTNISIVLQEPIEELLANSDERLAELHTLLATLNKSKSDSDRSEASKEADEKRALKQDLRNAQVQIELAWSNARTSAQETTSLRSQVDELKRAAKIREQGFLDLQRSHRRLLELLENERIGSERSKPDYSAQDFAEVKKALTVAKEHAGQMAVQSQASKSALVLEREARDGALREVGKLSTQLLEVQRENSDLHSKCEQLVADRDEWQEMAISYDQERKKLLENQIAITQQIVNQEQQKSRPLDDIGLLAHYCLPKVELAENSVEEIISNGWHRSSRRLWEELRKINDYKHGSDQGKQCYERIDDSKWFELREHISDGQQSNRIRVYFEIPKTQDERKKVHVMWKQDKKQQQRFHEQLDSSWSPFLQKRLLSQFV